MQVTYFGFAKYFTEEVNLPVHLVDAAWFISFDDQGSAYHMGGGSNVEEEDLSSGAVKTSGVRPGAAGLLIGIECSRVRDSSCMYLTSLVTTQIGVELAAVRRKLPDRAVVGLQLYSARTFHVNLSPRIYKGGQVLTLINDHFHAST